MNEKDAEISELKQFVAELEADRAAQKEKEKSESWTKYVSLSVVVMAVIAAVAAQWSGDYSGKMQMSQAQASDQWAFYQSKSIKQHLDESAREELARMGSPSDPTLAATLKKLDATIARYDKEKSEIRAKAEGLEKDRDDADKRSNKMGLSISYFTVAIAIASICTVTMKKSLWYASILLTGIGLTYMVVAWTM
jgi:uncharacterized membrane protein YoaK (UPF0700 family)